MKKFFSVGFATIGSLLLIFVIVFTAMEIVINNETFINNEFTKLEISRSMGISNNDLVRSTVRLIDYMEGDVESIDIDVELNGETVKMFALDQEVEHMRDVQTIYLQIRQYRDFSMLAMLVLFLFSAVINFRKAPQMLSQGYLSGSFIALLFFGFLGTWASMDFTSFWSFFHQMLFWNDLWLFDATESRMINMLPERMFSDIVGQIFLYAGLVIAGLIALSTLCLVVSSDAYKKRKIETLKRKKARKAAVLERKKARAKAKAEAEKAKRIAKKKAHRAQMQKKKEAAAKKAAKAREKAQRKQARSPGRPVETDPTRIEDDADVEIDPLETDPVSVSLSEGYASDYFRSATTTDPVSETTVTTTTTGGSLYPDTLSAEFFKQYGAASAAAEPVEPTLPDESGSEGIDLSVSNEAADYADGRTSAPAGRTTGRTGRETASATGRTTGRTGREAASATARKRGLAGKKSVDKKRQRIQDDTGFLDD